MDTLSVNLPFAGFYNTKWSDLVDSAEEREVEHSQSAQSKRDQAKYKAEGRPVINFDWRRKRIHAPV